MPARQMRDEQVALPFGDQLAVVEGDARRRGGRVPVIDGLDGAGIGSGAAIGVLAAGILATRRLFS